MYAITPQFGLSVAVFAASFIALGGVSLIVGAGGHASRVSPRIGPPGEPNYRIIGALVAKCMVDFALILLQIPIQGTSGEYRVKVAFDMLLPTSMAGTMLLEWSLLDKVLNGWRGSSHLFRQERWCHCVAYGIPTALNFVPFLFAPFIRLQQADLFLWIFCSTSVVVFTLLSLRWGLLRSWSQPWTSNYRWSLFFSAGGRCVVVLAAILGIIFGRVYPERQSFIVLILLAVASIQSSAQGLILHANSWIHLRRQHEAQESTRTINPFNTKAPQTPSGQRRDPTMDSDYTEYFKAFTPHTSQDGLAPESNGADGQDPEQLQGAQESQRSVELHNAGSDDRMSPTSATILTIVELQAQAMKNQRRNRQGSWPIVD